MMHKLIVASLLSALAMTACQKPAAINDKEGAASFGKVASTSTAPQMAPVQSSDQAQSQIQAQSQAQAQPNPISEKVDITQAHDINQDSDLSYLTGLFLAKTTRQMTDDEKLGLISADYANETDAFKKRALVTKLLPQLQTTLDKYKGTYVIKVPLIDQNATKNKFVLAQQQKKIE